MRSITLFFEQGFFHPFCMPGSKKTHTHTHTHIHTHIHTHRRSSSLWRRSCARVLHFAFASLRYSVYLLYSYKSTNTGAEGAALYVRSVCTAARESHCVVYWLYSYKSTNTDAEGAAVYVRCVCTAARESHRHSISRGQTFRGGCAVR